MKQNFTVTIEGRDVTKRVESTSISDEMNRFYNVASVLIDNTFPVADGSKIVIVYGSHTFNGFVYSVNRSGINRLVLEVRTETAKLTEPYSTSEQVVEDATTSHALCALYQSMSGIPIVNLSKDLDFGGSYERNGTMLSALQNIASVTGAEYYEQNNRVFIAPNKPVPRVGIDVPDADIFDFIATKRGVYNKGIGNVIVQNGGTTSAGGDIVAPNRIYVEIDEISGDIFIYLTPVGELERADGVTSLVTASIERKETKQMLDEDSIVLDGAIESIAHVKVNGIEVTGFLHETGFNIITLNKTVRGSVEVLYRATAKKGVVTTEDTPVGKFISVDLVYLDQLFKFQGFLKPGGSNTSSDGDMEIITEGKMVYDSGFSLYTIGGDPDFEFYDKNVFIGKAGVTSYAHDLVLKETMQLDENFCYTTRHNIKTILGVRSKNVDTPYTVTGNKICMGKYFPALEVSHTTEGKKHDVKFADIPDGEITMSVINLNTGSRHDYNLTNLDDSNGSGGVNCTLPIHYFVDVASEWGLSVTAVVGKIVPVYYNEVPFADLVVDNFGKVEVIAIEDGIYILDGSAFIPRTTTTLIVDTKGLM